MRIRFLIINLLFSLNFCFAQEFKVDYFHGDNNVNSISIIGDNVWVGGYLGLTRINRFNYTDNEFITNPFINHQNICFGVFAQKDTNGNLFSHDGFDLNSYQSGSVNLIDTGSYIIDFFIDENNTKWILRGNDITKIDANGNKITYNHNNSSLPNYYYTCIFAKNNEVFLGSSNGYVKFNGKSSQLFNSSNTAIPYSSISSIAVDKHDNIWLSCDTSGYEGRYYFHYNKLVKISGTNGTIFNPYTPNNIGSIRKIVPSEDTLYLCTTVGLIKFNGTAWTIIDKEQNQLLSDNISSIAFEGNKIWIGTDSGVSVISSDTTINLKLANASLSNGSYGPIIEDLSGNIWVGSGAGTTGILSKYDGSTWKTIIQGSRNNYISIYSLAVDKNNVVWATSYTFDGKLFKIENDIVTVYDQNNSPLPSFPEDLAVDKDNNIWITSDWEIIKFDGINWSKYKTSDIDYLKLPKSIAADKKGNVWIGVHYSGMAKFDGSNWIHYGDEFFGKEYPQVNDIIVDKDDNLWISYTDATLEQRIGKFDGNSFTWYDQNINLPPMAMNGGLLAVEKNGDLWLSYEINYFQHGIAKYDWKEWKYYNSTNSRLISNEIGSFAIDHNGNKWITAGCYVAKFNEDSIYNTNNNPLKNNNNVYSIFPNPCISSVFLRPLNLKNQGIQINIFNSKGSLIKSYTNNSKDEIELNLANYGSGFYLIQIIGKDFLETHKVLKKF